MIYLDNAATTFPKPEAVYKQVDYVQRNLAVNVGRGSYHVAREAMEIVDRARFSIANLVGIDNPNNVVFTPSATISANEILFGLEWDEYKTVYISPFEHNAIARPLALIREKYGARIEMIPFEKESHSVNWDKLRTMFATMPPDYLITTHVSNVTGTVLPVEKMCSLAKEYNAVTVVDGSQSVGAVPISLADSAVDYLIFAGHKTLYSSWGVGGFVSRRVPGLSPLLAGGTGSNSLDLTMGTSAPTRYEPASPNIIAIASLESSVKWLGEQGIGTIAEKKRQLVAKMVEGLKDCGCKLYLPETMEMHSSVVSFNVEGYTPAEVGTILSEDFDIAVRTGYHCAPYVHDFLETRDSQGTIRASVSFFNDETDVDALLKAVSDL